MVSRKPVGGPKVDTTNTAPDNRSAPYPITPIEPSTKRADTNTSSVYSPDLAHSPAFDLIGMEEARSKERRGSVSTNGTWDSDDDEEERDTPEEHDLPQPLRIAPSKARLDEEARGQSREDVPAILRPGPTEESRRRSQEVDRYDSQRNGNPWTGGQDVQQTQPQNSRMESNNPYLPYQQPQRPQAQETESSQSIWGDVPIAPPPPLPSSQPPPIPPTQEPAELSAVRTPSEELSKMSLGEQSRTGSGDGTYHTAEVLPVPQQGQPPFAPISEQHTGNPAGSNPWRHSPSAQEEGARPQSSSSPQPPYPTDDAYGSSTTRPQTPLYRDDQHHAQPSSPPPPIPPPQEQHNLIDHEPAPQPPPAFSPVPEIEPSQPHRPTPISTAQPSDPRSTGTVPETPSTRSRRQRNEHYQIKHIHWLDQSFSGSSQMRHSPILTQNENGPCPLLALVNALVLSTPKGLDTALIETLRTREQVSLGLLLDAVFDELMSGRRGDTATELPDVSDLYSFLLALHTGMNVNPRFVTPAKAPRGSFDGHPASTDNVHPIHRAQIKPGCFEETKEMTLYSTFNIPLLHGWTAPKDTPAYTAFERCAATFEEAQNIQFSLPELEHQLQTDGLSEAETQQLQDIQTIKQFLATWPTQLTDHGLISINESLKAGQIAILFRNDHFSTIYKEPRHGALMTLVTDAGYSSHAEIVWESLVDVNGAASEMFSGDFRTVSHDGDARLNQSNSAGGSEGWQTVPASNRNRQSSSQQYAPPAGPPPSHSRNNSSNHQEAPPALPGPRPTQQHSSTSSNATALHPSPHQDSQPPLSPAEQEDHDLALALQLQEEEEDHSRRASAQRRRETELSEQFLSRETPSPPNRNRPSSSSNRQNSSATGRRTSAAERAPTIPPRRTSQRPAMTPRPAETQGEGNGDLPPPSYDQVWQDRPYRPPGSTAQPSGQGNPLTAYEALRAQQVQGMGTPVDGGRQSAFAQQSGSVAGGPGVGLGRRTSRFGNGGGQQGVSGAAGTREAERDCVVM